MPFVKGPRDNWNLGNIYMSGRINNFQSRNLSTSKQITCSPCSSTAQVNLYNAKACVLSCIDFRLRDNIVCHLDLLGYKDNYDETCAAGASLGYNGFLDYNGENEIWTTYIDNHISIAYDLHSISQIIIIEHQQCGAYGHQYGTGTYLPLEEELGYQETNLQTAGPVLWSKFNPTNGTVRQIPNLEIIGYRISIDACTFEKIYYKNN